MFNNEEAKVLLYQPKTIPQKLLTDLSKYFTSHGVSKAYFSCIQFPNPDSRDDFLIAILADGDTEIEIEKINKYLLSALPDTQGKGVLIVDAKEEPFSNYFQNIKAFYEI